MSGGLVKGKEGPGNDLVKKKKRKKKKKKEKKKKVNRSRRESIP